MGMKYSHQISKVLVARDKYLVHVLQIFAIRVLFIEKNCPIYVEWDHSNMRCSNFQNIKISLFLHCCCHLLTKFCIGNSTSK